MYNSIDDIGNNVYLCMGTLKPNYVLSIIITKLEKIKPK